MESRPAWGPADDEILLDLGSPDGSRIAYVADADSDGKLEVYVAPSAGGDALKVNDSFIAAGNIAIIYPGGIAWSPLGVE